MLGESYPGYNNLFVYRMGKMEFGLHLPMEGGSDGFVANTFVTPTGMAGKLRFKYGSSFDPLYDIIRGIGRHHFPSGIAF